MKALVLILCFFAIISCTRSVPLPDPCFEKGEFAVSKLTGEKVFIVDTNWYNYEPFKQNGKRGWQYKIKRVNRNGDTVTEWLQEWELVCNRTGKEDRYK